MADAGTFERSPRSAPDERRLVTGAVGAVLAAAVPLAGGAAVLHGWPGALSALVGVGLVALLFGGSASLLVPVARLRPTRAVAVLVGGALARMALYVGVLAALAPFDWVHRRSLALATAAAVAITLAWELRLLSRMPRLFWVDATPRPGLANMTRSRSL